MNKSEITPMIPPGSTTGGRTGLQMDPGWGTLIAMMIGVIIVPVGVMVLLAHPMLGIGAIIGLLIRPVLAVGVRAWRVIATALNRVVVSTG